MKTINVTVRFTMQRASNAVCKQFAQPLGSIEVLDCDGFRHSFYETEEAATTDIKEFIEDALGMSGGVAIGNAVVEVVEE